MYVKYRTFLPIQPDSYIAGRNVKLTMFVCCLWIFSNNNLTNYLLIFMRRPPNCVVQQLFCLIFRRSYCRISAVATCVFPKWVFWVPKANAGILCGCRDESAHFQRKHSLSTFKRFYSLGRITITSRGIKVRANIWPKRKAITNNPPNLHLQALPFLCIGSKNRYHPNTAFCIFSQQMYLDNVLKKKLHNSLFFSTKFRLCHIVVYGT